MGPVKQTGDLGPRSGHGPEVRSLAAKPPLGHFAVMGRQAAHDRLGQLGLGSGGGFGRKQVHGSGPLSGKVALRVR